MSFTYSASSTMTGVSAVRFLVGNTSTGDPVVIADEEIGFALNQTGNIWGAAVLVAEGMLQQYASKSAGAVQSKTVGNLSLTYGDRAATLKGMLPNLKRNCAMRSVVPVAGGLTIAQRDARAADTSLVPNTFEVGMTDNPPGLANLTSTSY